MSRRRMEAASYPARSASARRTQGLAGTRGRTSASLLSTERNDLRRYIHIRLTLRCDRHERIRTSVVILDTLVGGNVQKRLRPLCHHDDIVSPEHMQRVRGVRGQEDGVAELPSRFEARNRDAE